MNNAIILGAGNLGKAIALHINFIEKGFCVKGIFETNPLLVGQEIKGIKIYPEKDMEKFISDNNISIAVLCIPKTSIAGIIDKLYSNGIKAFWNFSHYDISRKYSDTVVENVHMTDSLMTLSYRLNDNSHCEK